MMLHVKRRLVWAAIIQRDWAHWITPWQYIGRNALDSKYWECRYHILPGIKHFEYLRIALHTHASNDWYRKKGPQLPLCIRVQKVLFCFQGSSRSSLLPHSKWGRSLLGSGNRRIDSLREAEGRIAGKFWNLVKSGPAALTNLQHTILPQTRTYWSGKPPVFSWEDGPESRRSNWGIWLQTVAETILPLRYTKMLTSEDSIYGSRSLKACLKESMNWASVDLLASVVNDRMSAASSPPYTYEKGQSSKQAPTHLVWSLLLESPHS